MHNHFQMPYTDQHAWWTAEYIMHWNCSLPCVV